MLVDIKGRYRCTWEEVQLMQLITAEGSTDNSQGAETKSKAVRQKETNPSIKLPSNFYRYADLFNWIFLNNLNVQNVPRTKRSKYTWPLHGSWTQEKHDVFKRKVFTKIVVVFIKKPMAPISIYVFSFAAVSVWWWNTKHQNWTLMFKVCIFLAIDPICCTFTCKMRSAGLRQCMTFGPDWTLTCLWSWWWSRQKCISWWQQ